MNTITCGAKTRAGNPCKRSPMAGKRRCRNHGGMSTGAGNPARPGNRNARKHGIYSKTLTDTEQALLMAMSVGSLDDEVALARILLRRELADEIDPAKQMELVERKVTRSDGAVTIYRPPKLLDSILRLLGRIERLEALRAQLLANQIHRRNTNLEIEQRAMSSHPEDGITITVRRPDEK